MIVLKDNKTIKAVYKEFNLDFQNAVSALAWLPGGETCARLRRHSYQRPVHPPPYTAHPLTPPQVARTSHCTAAQSSLPVTKKKQQHTN